MAKNKRKKKSSNKKSSKKHLPKKKPNTLGFCVAFIAWLAFFATGVFCVYKVGEMLYEQHVSFVMENQVTVTITKTQIKETYPLNKFGQEDKNNPSYSPEVQYSYEENGQTYTSKRLLPDTETMDMPRRMVEKVIDQFPVGESFSAYRSAQDPQKTFLLKVVNPYPYIFWLSLLLPFHLVILFLFPILAIRWPQCNEFSATRRAKLTRFTLTFVWYFSGIVVAAYECYLTAFSPYSDLQAALSRLSVLSILMLMVFIPWLRFILQTDKD
ncbi:DUF3592 domain-containing protein [Candidatus Uabimicrobium amorphum]|uniref:DUF3592 domain-containing protein n=1 Tax=Uabimicrobium amorphum TaxID=2596890 RepID=A0A5S9ILD7_UABAM|nr:DUF3592 domain-containing protein [Candidatus Uabimicrobium amorphum]BBM83482.1 hypothetical protein UABAM_01834 [Candidatus Uabimicrobium amorphum]